jgi:uncharacterized membrane protein (UPF0127 family)
MNGRFWLISILSLVVALLVGSRWILPLITTNTTKHISVETRELMVGEAKVMVEVADSEEEMHKGLGDRESMDKNTGMLFIYPETMMPTFWMKGMRFDLDFIWIRDGMVVDITENVAAPMSEQQQLPLIRPTETVNWILEVNAGWVEKNEVRVGDGVRFIED